jgi:hypothetical protein
VYKILYGHYCVCVFVFRAVSSNEVTVAPVQHLCYEKVTFGVDGRVLLYVYDV